MRHSILIKPSRGDCCGNYMSLLKSEINTYVMGCGEYRMIVNYAECRNAAKDKVWKDEEARNEDCGVVISSCS